ncbi:MAG: hypothetical protein ACYDA3_03765 [Gaiellaceae bacterium]
MTPTVVAGGVLVVDAAVSNVGVSCRLRIMASGAQHNGGIASAAAGRATWSYRVRGDAPTGVWQARVGCDHDWSSLRSFVVVAPVQIDVSQRGFTVTTDQLGGTDLEYGLALTNPSERSDAIGVAVTVNFLDAAGQMVASDSNIVTGIPAGKTFYLGDFRSTDQTLLVASIDVVVRVHAWQPRRLVLPPVTNLTVTPPADQYSGVTVTGAISNPYRDSLTGGATIYAVYLDSAGKIIGGDYQTTDKTTPSGALLPFTFGGVFDPVASAQISVDPCNYPFYLLGVGTCPALAS